jgi:hypothetical protein
VRRRRQIHRRIPARVEQSTVVRGPNSGIIVNVHQGSVSVNHSGALLNDEDVLALNTYDVLDYVDQQLAHVELLWNVHSASVAESAAIDLDRMIRQLLATPRAPGRAREALLRRRAVLAIERTQINTRRLRGGEIRASSEPLIELVRRIAAEVDDQQVACAAHLAQGHLAYNIGENARARETILEVLHDLSDPDIVLGAHRTLAVVAGRLGDESTLRASASAIRRTVEAGAFGDAGHALKAFEGVARGEFYLGRGSCHDALAPAREIEVAFQQTTESVPTDCSVLLGRTECDILAAYHPAETDHLQTVAKETMVSARRSGHTKYLSQLAHFLTEDQQDAARRVDV